MTGTTAKQAHRAQAFDLHRDDLGLVRCCLRDEPEHTCGGRLQSHHVLPVQTLTRLHAQAVRGRSMIGIRPEWEDRLADRDLETIIADARNSQILCELGHRQIELGRFAVAPSEHLRAFAADLGLSHYLPIGDPA